MTTSIALLWPLFPLFFALLWVTVCFVVSFGGWRALSEHFRTDSKPPGQSFGLQSAEIGGGRYRGCLGLIVAESGLYLRTYFPFRAFHPPLLVPWKAFELPQLEKRFWVQIWVTHVQTPDKKRIKIYFSAPVAQAIAAQVQASKAAPDDSPWS